MALKDTWADKVDYQDRVKASDINQVAHAVIELEESGGTGDGSGLSEDGLLNISERFANVDEITVRGLNIENAVPVEFSTTDYALIDESGAVIEFTDENYHVSSLIEIKAGTPVHIVASSYWGKGLFAWYNKDKETIYCHTADNSGTKILFDDTIVAPLGACYLRIAWMYNPVGEVKVWNTYDDTAFKEGITESISEVNASNNRIMDYVRLLYDGANIASERLDIGANENYLLSSDISKPTAHESDIYVISDIVPIEPHTLYKVKATTHWGKYNYVIADENKNTIVAVQTENIATMQTVDEIIYTPADARYIRISWTTDNVGYIEKVTGVRNVFEWEGIKWAVVGDSLTEHNARATKNYHDYIAEKTGIQVINMGLSGSGYKAREGENLSFYQRILNIDTDVEVVTIFGSGNDLSHELGEPTDTGTTTLCGCINTAIDNLYSILPMVRLGIISPTPWQFSVTDEPMRKYSAALESICKRRGIPFLDLFNCSGLRPNDETFRELAYSRDNGSGVHPDENGHALIAPRFKAFLETLLL